MSELICPVVKLEKSYPIAGADNLEFFCVFGNGPVVVSKGQFRPGDLAVFIPPETLVDTSGPDFSFLASKARSDGKYKLKPTKLRGQLSVGLLVPCHSPMQHAPGENLAGMFAVEKAPEDPLPATFAADQAPPPYPGIPTYDINRLWAFESTFIPDATRMAVTEKIHGTNARFCLVDNKIVCGSRNRWLKDGSSVYHDVAKRLKLESKMQMLPKNYVLWGEIYGPGVQKGWEYGAQQKEFRAFDLFDIQSGTFLAWNDMATLCEEFDIPLVPLNSPFDDPPTWKELQPHLNSLVCMPSMHAGTVREGIVIRPAYVEGFAMVRGRPERAIAKLINSEFLSK